MKHALAYEKYEYKIIISYITDANMKHSHM